MRSLHSKNTLVTLWNGDGKLVRRVSLPEIPGDFLATVMCKLYRDPECPYVRVLTTVMYMS